SRPLFDAYLFVDWSGAGKKGPLKPKKDNVWIGHRVRGTPRGSERYCRTRAEAMEYVERRLREHVAASRRVLLGLDFAYGYPAGFADALGLAGDDPPWRMIWREIRRRITDGPDNANNRFGVAGQLNAAVRAEGLPGPFWGRPKKTAVEGLPVTSPAYPAATRRGVSLPKFRRTETRVGTAIFSTWQVFYTGSVGGQVLMGLPRVDALRDHPDFAMASSVWPFETGFTTAPTPAIGPFVLHAEIWPSVGRERVEVLIRQEPGLIKDQAQVRAMCEWAEGNDSRGTLGAYFDTPAGLTAAEVQACTSEEGWILGVS
ncbi:MAG: cobalamin biosynthesis protein CbiG, partial [Deltaproteobacteria bacterium]|nr:cobalamin biosynthesis protein CbiG [Deltaproteobacteria bacterium]